MEESPEKYSDLFKRNVDNLIELAIQIIDYAKQEGVETTANAFLLKAGRLYISTYDDHTSITGFIKRSYIHWDRVLARDNDFLINNSSVLFNEVSQENLEPFTSLFTLKLEDGELFLPDETRDSLWEVVEAMISQCIMYMHLYRKPVKGEGYTNEYFQEISIGRHILPKWREIMKKNGYQV